MMISSSTATPPAAGAQRPSSTELFKQLDSDNKGYLTETDLASALVSISPAGASAADAADEAQAMLAQMDGNGDGQLTQAEFETAAETAQQQQRGSQGGPPPGGAAGRGGPPPAAASEGSSQEYEPADANEDGKVTEQEQLAYDTAQALKAYEAVAQAD